MPLLGATGGGSAKGFGALANLGYFIRNSLRFRASATAYLNRTLTTPTNNKIWTYSAWVKRGTIASSSQQHFFNHWTGGNGQAGILFSSNTDTIEFFDYTGSYGYQLVTTQVFRDPSAWYHFVIAVDTTQATAANRIKMYVNGNQITAFGTSTYPSQNYNTLINSANAHYIGRRGDAAGYFDGYIAEQNFIDGSQLTPSSFGKTDTGTGQWVPKKFAGTYGTNGFYLKFADASAATAAAIGKDSSGNGNNWTPNNISVTAGVTYDAMIDSPTLTSATVANYATWNAAHFNAAGYVLSGGNLNTAYSSGTGAGLKTYSTIGITSGKWYSEYTLTSANPNFYLGWRTEDDSIGFSVGCSTGNLLTETTSGGSFSGSTTSVTNTDVIGLAFDYENSTAYYYKNNTLVFTLTGFITSGSTLFVSTGIWSGGGGASSGATTFGQRPFAYTPPAGFKSLNTFNLP